MQKQLRLSYKVYFNTRLQMVPFHGNLTTPLYIQLIYKQKPQYFKSSYFDQLGNPKYTIRSILGNYAPMINQVTDSEEKLLKYLSEKHQDNVDINAFKAEYYFLSQDLLFHLEERFQQFLITFFHDKGLPVLAFLISEGGKQSTAEHILNDLKTSLDHKLFTKLTENAIHYAPPYIPLCAFLRSIRRQAVPFLSILEWNSNNFKNEFKPFLNTVYPSYHFDQVDQYLNELKESFR
ncbi:hypothetical protein [Dyadobacter diqingensis]|uniref:hypothetical protein n=1 Tax=Dyadobacter diqingensis TaxID=2938121 RepID=UPI0020C1B666|nr:hypothetical protein [Dyadobacter diqingensis]